MLDVLCYVLTLYVFLFKQKTAYEMRISDWSSDVCSSDLAFARRAMRRRRLAPCLVAKVALARRTVAVEHQIVRGAHDIGKGVRNRTHAPVGQPHPQVLEQILGAVDRAANLEEAHDTVAVGKQHAFDALGGVGSIMRIGHGLLALERHPIGRASCRERVCQYV